MFDNRGQKRVDERISMKFRYFKGPTPEKYRPNTNKQVQATGVSPMQWLKLFREAGGGGLT